MSGGAAGAVVALQVSRREHGPIDAVDEVVAVAGRGLEGDRHADRGARSVLLVEAGDLRDLGLRPGDLREQITVELPGLMSLAPGTTLRIGETALEVTKVCEPCTHIGAHVGVDDVERFRDSLHGRRGMLARVIRGGAIRVGDPATVVPEPARA
jgi:MOSC domain-containing protein YiiM